MSIANLYKNLFLPLYILDMHEKFLFIVIFLFISQSIFSQKKFDLTILLDRSIDSKKISCSYFDGKKDFLVTDTFINNTLKLKGTFYSKYVSVHIQYVKSNLASYSNDFFVSERPAKISFHFNENAKDNLLVYGTIINATPCYDTNYNKIFKELVKYRKKEAQAVSDLWEKHGNEINNNDSLMGLNKKLFILLNNRTLSFLKNHSQNYFSFWYFRKQVVEPSINFFKKDTAYLKSLIVSLKSIFPKKYTESIEGQEIIYHIDGIVNPPKENTLAPQFVIKDIDGVNIKLSNFKGKYVLLDFWATWCPPCMREIPFIKKIRNDFPAEKLIIIGVNIDRSFALCKAAILKNTMNWVHIFDEENKISNLFGVLSIPATILINKQGVIIYNSGEREDKEQLEKLLIDM